MTVEASIYTALLTACPRAFPDVAPAGTARPYIVYQQVGGEAPFYVERALVSKKNGRFQISTWATTRLAAAALALQAEAALLLATSMQVTPIGAPIATYDEDTLLYGTQQDFSVWSDR